MNRLKLAAFILGTVFIIANCTQTVDSSDYSCPYSPDISSSVLSPYGLYTDISGSDLIVMSRNLYLGTDLSALLSGDDPLEILSRSGILIDNVIDSEFPRRARGIAREIKEINPDIIGLQEVVKIFTGETDFFDNPVPPNADCEEYEFLDILMEALEDEGLDYSIAVESENADIEITDLEKDIRLTDRDVILVKTELTTDDVIYDNFSLDNSYTVDVSGAIDGLDSVVVLRGYCGVLVTKDLSGTGDGPFKTVRIINTHLEISANPVKQVAQGDELIAVIDGPDGLLITEDYPIILIGDLNSGPDPAFETTYDNIMAIANIEDTWDDTRDGDNTSGIYYTCCYSSNLTSGDLNERIDHILYVNQGTDSISDDNSFITETDPGEKIEKTDSSDIWPSDHAGRVTGFTFD